MDDGELYARAVDGLRGFYRVLERSSPDTRLVELGGVTAIVMPAAPERSFCNAVLYEDPGALVAAIDRLAHAYEDAGVRAWTVWVHESDGEVAAALERAGHVLDASPSAMGLELERFEQAPSPDLDVDADGNSDDVARINDAAYGYDGDFMRAIRELAPGEARLYVARVDGNPCSSVGAFDHGDNCDISLVATLPEAGGRGLATALMVRALADARERGCATSTLVATRQGRPIYERLGYRPLGTLQMWERRKA
jgi:GNAT superfamily N-acetyltransferase